MASGDDLKTISKAQLHSADILIAGGDHLGAAQMLARSLECALKSVICKTLGLSRYPENTKKFKHVDDFFMTHELGALLIASGMSPIFDKDIGADEKASYHWDQFTAAFPGNWTNQIYSPEAPAKFDAVKVKELYNHLIDQDSGIMTVIEKQGKW